MGFDILEWKSPSSTGLGSEDYVSGSAQFEEFIRRGDAFRGLDLDMDNDSGKGNPEGVRNLPGRRVLLVEEFPTVLTPNSPQLSSFRSSLQRYLAATAPRSSNPDHYHPDRQASAPIIIVASETFLSSASSMSESFTVHRLLGPGLCNHEGTTIIDFNSIAPTYMHKALRSVMEKEVRSAKRVAFPGNLVLEKLSELGDIRSAISALEFLCLKDDRTAEWSGGPPSKTKKMSSKKSTPMTLMEKCSLDAIVHREASLGIFHAVGKILYNKREDASLAPEGAVVPPAPPEHLRSYSRPKVSYVPVNDLVDDTGTDVQTYLCALHENYVPSCNGSDFTDTLDECIQGLSDGDILAGDRRGTHRSRFKVGSGGATFSNTGVDVLRQNELSYQVATRRLLFSLPYPVKRCAVYSPLEGHMRDAYRFYFPASLRLWTECERMEGLMETSMRGMSDPLSAPVLGTRSSGSETAVRSWKRDNDAANQDSRAFAPTKMTSSRDDMLLYQMPYMAKILNCGLGSSIGQLTGFGGLHIADDNGGFDVSGNPTDDLTPSMEPMREKPDVEEDHFILSDDDIEDD